MNNNFTYNPNVDLTDYRNKYEEEQFEQQYKMPPQPQYQMPPQQYQMPPPQPQYQMPPPQQKYQMPQRNRVANNIEKIDIKEGMSLSTKSLLKKIFIYFCLFIIFSHKIMTNLMCSKISFLNNNELLCLLLKGGIFTTVLILIQKFLKI